MATNSPNRSTVSRAAAILTTGEVAGASIDLNETFNSSLSLQVDFTLGSLTNVTVRQYVSMNGSTWYEHRTNAGVTTAVVLSANSTINIPVHAPGWKFFRPSVQGSGTVTSSSATLTHRYLRRGSQA